LHLVSGVEFAFVPSDTAVAEQQSSVRSMGGRPAQARCNVSKTILVIEDNPEERNIFASYLEFVGGRLLEAENGERGLDLARTHHPDLILMDLSMPIMDGWETMRRLHADEETADIPVVAITGHHLPGARLEAAGFCGYLEKPIAPFRVLEEVERCLGPLTRSIDRSSAQDHGDGGMPAM
jgi:two-component system, cell cycle response regulator DivK